MSYKDGEKGSLTSHGRKHSRPFGEQLEGAVNDVGYTGHIYDQHLGLNYMQARYYDPIIGRFYSNDPVDAVEAIRRGSPVHGFNRYVYAQNNPYKYTDPDGKWIVHAFAAVVGGAISGYQTYQSTGGDISATIKSTVIGAGSAALSLSPGGIARNVGKSFGVGATADATSQVVVDGKSPGDVNLLQSTEAGAKSALGTLTGSAVAKNVKTSNMPSMREPTIAEGRTLRSTAHPGTAKSDKLKQGLTGSAVGATSATTMTEIQNRLHDDE